MPGIYNIYSTYIYVCVCKFNNKCNLNNTFCYILLVFIAIILIFITFIFRRKPFHLIYIKAITCSHCLLSRFCV